MLLVALLKPPFLESLTVAPWIKTIFNTITGLVLIASQIAIAAFLGATEKIRAGEEALFGYVIGIVITLAVAWAVRPKKLRI